MLHRRTPEAGADATQADPEIRPRRAGAPSLPALEAVRLPDGKGMQVLFLQLLFSFCHQTLMKTLTWTGGTEAYWGVAPRNQSPAFRRFNRGWDRKMDGAEESKRQKMYGSVARVPPRHRVSAKHLHEPGTVLSHLGHSGIYIKGSCPPRCLLVTLTSGRGTI